MDRNASKLQILDWPAKRVHSLLTRTTSQLDGMRARKFSDLDYRIWGTEPAGYEKTLRDRLTARMHDCIRCGTHPNFYD
jgi:hypothetical protein